MEQKKQYIAPNELGRIDGIAVVANLFTKSVEDLQSGCEDCVIQTSHICFSRIDRKSIETRPACFGNDKENLSKQPIFYRKA